MIMELGIIGSHLIWLYRTRHIRKVVRDGERSFGESIRTSVDQNSWYNASESRRNSRYNPTEGKACSFTAPFADEKMPKKPETAVYCGGEGELFRYSAAA